MKKLIVLTILLALVVATSPVFAGPSENSPWELQCENCCDHPSTPAIGDGDEYLNTKTGKIKCFKS
jgi:hypothetical protein